MSMNQKKKFHFQKTNHHASLRFLFLITLLICNGYQIYLDNTYQIIFILFQGLLLVSLFAPLHECSHSTAFKSKITMQTESFNPKQEAVEMKDTDRLKSFNLRLDSNLGMQLALISGLSGILYYLFSYTCPSSI